MSRRHAVVALAAGVCASLLLGSCGTTTPSSPRTVTTIVTRTAGPGAGSDASGGGVGGSASPGITVVNPDATGPAGAIGAQGGPSSAGGPGSPPQSGQTPTAPGGGPSATGEQGGTAGTPSSASSLPSSHGDAPEHLLQTSCAALLSSSDIDRALGAQVPAKSVRIVDVANPDVQMTGRIKCYYGTDSISGDRPVAVALARYATAEAAAAQTQVTVRSEVSLGAQESTVDLSGTQGRVLLRDGGLLIAQPGAWTLSIAVRQGVAGPDALPAALQRLGTMVLTRVTKAG